MKWSCACELQWRQRPTEGEISGDLQCDFGADVNLTPTPLWNSSYLWYEPNYSLSPADRHCETEWSRCSMSQLVRQKETQIRADTPTHTQTQAQTCCRVRKRVWYWSMTSFQCCNPKVLEEEQQHMGQLCTANGAFSFPTYAYTYTHPHMYVHIHMFSAIGGSKPRVVTP